MTARPLDGGLAGPNSDHTSAVPLVDATEFARLLGVSRDFVYAHADEYGAVRLGSGSRPRLRFDPRRVASGFAGRGSEGVASPDAERKPPSRRRRRSGTSAGLLPIKGSPCR